MLKEATFVQKLSELDRSSSSIQGLAKWMSFYGAESRDVVTIWFRELRACASERKLVFLYLANELLQTYAKREQRWRDEFVRVMHTAFTHVLRATPAVHPNLLKLIRVWRERSVFDAHALEELETAARSAAAASAAAAAAAAAGGGGGTAPGAPAASSTLVAPAVVSALAALSGAVGAGVSASATDGAGAASADPRLRRAAPTAAPEESPRAKRPSVRAAITPQSGPSDALVLKYTEYLRSKQRAERTGEAAAGVSDRLAEFVVLPDDEAGLRSASHKLRDMRAQVTRLLEHQRAAETQGKIAVAALREGVEAVQSWLLDVRAGIQSAETLLRHIDSSNQTARDRLGVLRSGLPAFAAGSSSGGGQSSGVARPSSPSPPRSPGMPSASPENADELPTPSDSDRESSVVRGDDGDDDGVVQVVGSHAAAVNGKHSGAGVAGSWKGGADVSAGGATLPALGSRSDRAAPAVASLAHASVSAADGAGAVSATATSGASGVHDDAGGVSAPGAATRVDITSLLAALQHVPK